MASDCKEGVRLSPPPPGPCVAYLLLYDLYHFESRTQRLVSAPFIRLLGRERVKVAYRRRGVSDVVSEVEAAVSSPVTGPSGLLAGVHFIGLVAALLFGTACLLAGLSGRKWMDFPAWVAVLMPMALAYGLSELIVFSGDRHLKWFQYLCQPGVRQRYRPAWISLLAVVAIWAYGIGMFLAWHL